ELTVLREERPARAKIEREIAPASADIDGYFASIDRAVADASKQLPTREPLLRSVTLRMVLLRDRAYVRVDVEPDTYVYPIQLTGSTQGFYFVEWNANANLWRIIELKNGNAETRKRWSDPVLGGERELNDQRRERKGVVWVTQTVGAAPEQP